MAERLSASECALLARTHSARPPVVCRVDLLDVAGADDPEVAESLTATLLGALASVPRLRQRPVHVPGVVPPVWHDVAIDPADHVTVRRLGRLGVPATLPEWVELVLTRPLPVDRPLWHVDVVHQGPGRPLALVWRLHAALVDGVEAVDPSLVLATAEPVPAADPTAVEPIAVPTPDPDWSTQLTAHLAGVLNELTTDPARAWDMLERHGAGLIGSFVDVARGWSRAETAGEVAETVLQGHRPWPDSPLTGPSTPHRRLEWCLADTRRLAGDDPSPDEHSAHVGLLAALTSALRVWLGPERVERWPELTLFDPRPVDDDAEVLGALGCRMDPRLVRLPVGEPDPRRRREVLRARAVEAGDWTPEEVASLAGAAAPTLHALATRASCGPMTRRPDLTLSDVAAPGRPLSVAGHPWRRSWPIPMLGVGHQVAIAATRSADRTAVTVLTDAALVGGDELRHLVRLALQGDLP